MLVARSFRPSRLNVSPSETKIEPDRRLGCNYWFNSFGYRKLRRVCRQCLSSDKKLKSQLVGDPQGIDDDAKSDVSELSHRTESMLSDPGSLDANDGPSSPQPGTCNQTCTS